MVISTLLCCYQLMQTQPFQDMNVYIRDLIATSPLQLLVLIFVKLKFDSSRFAKYKQSILQYLPTHQDLLANIVHDLVLRSGLALIVSLIYLLQVAQIGLDWNDFASILYFLIYKFSSMTIRACPWIYCIRIIFGPLNSKTEYIFACSSGCISKCEISCAFGWPLSVLSEAT